MISGKGMWIHKVKNVAPNHRRDLWPTKVQEAVDAGLRFVVIKIADGRWRYNLRWDAGQGMWIDDLLPDSEAGQGWVSLFQDAGIKVLGFQWNYWSGWHDPVNEAKVAAVRVGTLNLDGFVANGEKHVKGKVRETEAYVDYLLGAMAVKKYFTSYRYPDLHKEVHWAKWNQLDGFFPQVYWQGASDAGDQLKTSHNQYRKWFGDEVVYHPIGSAYYAAGWTPTPGQFTEFLKTAVSLGLESASGWEWWYAHQIPGMWSVISAFDWPDGSGPVLTLEQRVERLEGFHGL